MFPFEKMNDDQRTSFLDGWGAATIGLLSPRKPGSAGAAQAYRDGFLAGQASLRAYEARKVAQN